MSIYTSIDVWDGKIYSSFSLIRGAPLDCVGIHVCAGNCVCVRACVFLNQLPHAAGYLMLCTCTCMLVYFGVCHVCPLFHGL